MGMTIDEALKVWLPIIRMGVETMPECKEALDMAINTTRKYQKIEEIMHIEMNGKEALQEIERILRG